MSSTSGLRILSLSTVFPNPQEPGLGLFVQSRLRALAKLTDLRVIAPIPVVDYSNPHKKWFHMRRKHAMVCQGDIEVIYPRWAYPPGGTPLNVACLFARLCPMLAKLRRERGFDVIDAHFGYPEGVVAAFLARLFNIPFSITLRGSEIPFAKYPMRRQLMEWALPQASVVFAVSDELRQFAIGCGVSDDHIQKVPNGVDSTIFKPRPQTDSRTAFGIARHRKVIVSAGELISAKGHHRVVQALPGLLAAGYDAEIIIAGGVARGGQPFDNEILKLTEHLGLRDRVRMLGWIPRETLAEVLSAADVFCLASDIEGWPNVVHEALSCGTPVVVTRVGAVPEMVPTEDLGLIVPVGDQSALAEALERALARGWDRNAIARWGRSRGWDKVAEEVYAAITLAVNSNRNREAVTA